jgi:RNA polymerase sigma-70 factor, ECF subfamily
MSHPEEVTWIRRAQEGDHEAFAALVGCHRQRLYRLLYGMTRDAHAAEDLTQDVLVKAWTHLGSFRPGTYFQSWLARIARNAFLNGRRRKQFSIPHDGLPETLVTREPGPDAAMLGRETQALVDAAVARLPGKTRAAFVLRTRDELPFPEIGRALSLTATTARWHFFQARQLLVQRLGATMKEKKA